MLKNQKRTYVNGIIKAKTDARKTSEDIERILGKRDDKTGRLPRAEDGTLKFDIRTEKEKSLTIRIEAIITGQDNLDDLAEWFDRIAYDTREIKVTNAAINGIGYAGRNFSLTFDEDMARQRREEPTLPPTKSQYEAFGERRVIVLRHPFRDAQAFRTKVRPLHYLNVLVKEDGTQGKPLMLECDGLPFNFDILFSENTDAEAPDAWAAIRNDTYVAFNDKAYGQMIEQIKLEAQKRFKILSLAPDALL